jgi:anti-sigma28 factor (negative regulator of flagellin synthesis)
MAKKRAPKRGPRGGPADARPSRVEAIRQEVEQGTYDEEQKLRIALDRMIDRLLERSKR